MQAQPHRKFVFERPLGSPSTASEAVIAMPGGAASADVDIEAIRKDAHADGFAEGIEKGRAEGRRDAEAGLADQVAEMVEERLAEELAARDATALENLARSLPALHEQLETARLSYERQAVETAIGLIKRLTPRLLSQAAEQQCADLLADVVKAASSSPQLEVLAPLAMAEAVENQLRALAQKSGFGGKLVVTPDATLSHGAVTARWQNGGAAWDPKALRQQIDDTAALILCRLNGDDTDPSEKE